MAGKNAKPRKKPRRLLRFILVLALIAALTVGGVYFVMNHVLQHLGAKDAAPQSGADQIEQLPALDAESYYAECGDVLDVIPASESDNVRTEKDVSADFKARGFTETITTPYSMGGKYLGEQEISSGSTRTHPTYAAYYVSEQDILWYIIESNGALTAQPLVNDPRWDVPILLSEAETVMAYDSANNSFCEITPDPEAYDIRVVDRIDAAFLDALTEGEVASL